MVADEVTAEADADGCGEPLIGEEILDTMDAGGSDEAGAAVRIQARYRGNQARTGKGPAEVGEEPLTNELSDAEAMGDEAGAAVRIQARYRGNKARSGEEPAEVGEESMLDEQAVAEVMEAEGVNEAEAAVRIQARYRGNQTRQAQVPETPEEFVVEDDAVEEVMAEEVAEEVPEESQESSVGEAAAASISVDESAEVSDSMVSSPAAPWPAGRSPTPVAARAQEEDPASRPRKGSKIQFAVDEKSGSPSAGDAAMSLGLDGASTWFSQDSETEPEPEPVAEPERLVPSPPDSSTEDKTRHTRRHLADSSAAAAPRDPQGPRQPERGHQGRPDDVSVEESIERLSKPQAPAAAPAAGTDESGDPFMAAMVGKLKKVEADVSLLQGRIIERTINSQQLCHEVASENGDTGEDRAQIIMDEVKALAALNHQMEQLILLETEFRKAIHQQKKLMKARRTGSEAPSRIKDPSSRKATTGRVSSISPAAAARGTADPNGGAAGIAMSAEGADSRHSRYGQGRHARQPHRRQQVPGAASTRTNRHARQRPAGGGMGTGRSARNQQIGEATEERAHAISFEQHRIMEEKHDRVMAKVINNQIEMQSRIDRMASGF